MRQLVQNYKTGELSLEDVPVPLVRPGCVLVKTRSSAISVGSEKAVAEFASKNLARKAMARPDLVRQVVNRAKKEGIISTFQHAMHRLDMPLPMGYSSCGEIIEVGAGSSEFNVGDIVALNGTGYAPHAEYTVTPYNLAVKVPEEVSPEAAAFGAIGGIAMEGVRNAESSPGSIVAVFGLGVVGLFTVQILLAYGYQTIGIDPDDGKLAVARKLGLSWDFKPDGNLINSVQEITHGQGVDASIICAAAKDSRPIEQSASICRYRGKIVMVGVTEMTLNRRPFYDKELSFVVSKSTGPGKSDPVYELDGVDYPVGLVRWSEKRNIKEFLRLIALQRIDVAGMITHRLPLENAVDFYQRALKGEAGNIVGAVINYPEVVQKERKIWLRQEKVSPEVSGHNVGLIGSGLFAKNVLYPMLKDNLSVHLRALAAASGLTSNDSGKKFKVDYITTDYHELLNDPNVDIVFITTRHSDHAPMIVAALKAGKSVFVEKPLATTPEELSTIEEAYHKYPGEVMTGFCRRYSPAANEMIRLLKQVTAAPAMIHYRVNAGPIPPEHWVQREEGRRIVGEVCHFIDFVCALTGSFPLAVSAACLSGEGNLSLSDNISIMMRMSDGSISNILYCSNGDKSFSREYIEVYSGGHVLINDDFRKIISYGQQGKSTKKWSRRDLGYRGEIDYFLNMVCEGRGSTFNQDIIVTKTTFAILQALGSQKWIELSDREECS